MFRPLRSASSIFLIGLSGLLLPPSAHSFYRSFSECYSDIERGSDFDPLEIEFICNCALGNQNRMTEDQAASYCAAKFKQRRRSSPAYIPVPVPSRAPRAPAPSGDICSGLNRVLVRQHGLDWCDERIQITPRQRFDWEFGP